MDYRVNDLLDAALFAIGLHSVIINFGKCQLTEKAFEVLQVLFIGF